MSEVSGGAGVGGAQMVIYQKWLTVWADGWLVGVALLFAAMDNLAGKPVSKCTVYTGQILHKKKKYNLYHSSLVYMQCPWSLIQFLKMFFKS